MPLTIAQSRLVILPILNGQPRSPVGDRFAKKITAGDIKFFMDDLHAQVLKATSLTSEPSAPTEPQAGDEPGDPAQQPGE